MSTSEFDNERDDQCIDSSLLLRQEFGLPEDFTAEDIAFAQELETLFAPDKEELPPYFVQTLLEAENPIFQPVIHGLEHKTHAKVFRRLKLHRRLFHEKSVPLPSLAQYVTRPQRPVLALLVACLLFIVFTVVATGPSFASGLNVLLTSRHGGVLLVNGYPSLSSTKKAKNSYTVSTASSMSPKKITLLEAQQQVEFPIYRPLVLPDRYTLSSTYLYQGVNQSWADGPAIELEYTYERQGSASHGTGKISVSEFKPQGQVLQVVQLGAAHSLQIGRDGHAQAIYVDGQWVRISRFSHDWVYGGRSEIIYEHDGVIFWIVGDQRDGIGQQILLAITNSLQPFDMRAIHMVGRVNDVIVPFDNLAWPFADDIVYTNEQGGSSLEIISAGFPSLSVQVSSNKSHKR